MSLNLHLSIFHVECFNSKPNAHGAFWNLHTDIKINLNINTSDSSRSVPFNFNILCINGVEYKVQKPIKL